MKSRNPQPADPVFSERPAAQVIGRRQRRRCSAQICALAPRRTVAFQAQVSAKLRKLSPPAAREQNCVDGSAGWMDGWVSRGLKMKLGVYLGVHLDCEIRKPFINAAYILQYGCHQSCGIYLCNNLFYANSDTTCLLRKVPILHVVLYTSFYPYKDGCIGWLSRWIQPHFMFKSILNKEECH